MFASIAFANGLLFTNIYNSMIDAKSWGADLPHSIETARQYFKSITPGKFFRIFAPINLILALVTLILFWRVSTEVRTFLGVAFALYVLVDVFTFAYFYPRNNVMFKTAQLTDVDAIRKAWTGWNSMNWLRSFIIFAGLVFSFLALHEIYTAK
ncbi:MAG TPA: DUF1772 domain-containing protein [Chitinophagaceae bacterium]|nr:DUF1772 domain-containing protein [Chitinophagaceae bacterium]